MKERTKNGHTYIIGEVGQNHNGDFKLACELIDMATMPIEDKYTRKQLPPVDAVKFTKRELTQELSADMAARPYLTPHAFGKTYGEHRQKLELTYEQHAELYHYAKKKNVDFIETVTAIGALKLLDYFTPDFIKVASRDINNHPLIEEIAKTGIPVIVSSGMSDLKELSETVSILEKRQKNVTILHCISEYPAQYENVNLRSIDVLKKNFPDNVIGYSDHSIGIMVPIAAVAMGASVIEKHITIDRNLKGSDQFGSLEPKGLWRMVRDIRNLEASFGEDGVFVSGSARDSFKKLGRSLAAKVTIPAGTVILESMLHLLSPGDGFIWSERGRVVGRRTSCNIQADSIIYEDMVD